MFIQGTLYFVEEENDTLGDWFIGIVSDVFSASIPIFSSLRGYSFVEAFMEGDALCIPIGTLEAIVGNDDFNILEGSSEPLVGADALGISEGSTEVLVWGDDLVFEGTKSEALSNLTLNC